MDYNRSGGIIGNHRGLTHSQFHMSRDLVVESHNDLALIVALIWPLDVLNLQSVGGTGRVVAHARISKMRLIELLKTLL